MCCVNHKGSNKCSHGDIKEVDDEDQDEEIKIPKSIRRKKTLNKMVASFIVPLVRMTTHDKIEEDPEEAEESEGHEVDGGWIPK